MGATRFVFTQDDLVAAQKAWWEVSARWQTFLKVLAGLGAIYVGFGLAISFDQAWHARARLAGVFLLIALVVTVVLFAIGRFRAPGLARRSFREHKLLEGEFQWEWAEGGVTITHEMGTTRLPWSKFYGWAVGPQTLMLYQTRILFNAVPRRVVAQGDVEEIVGHLRAAGTPERKRFGFLAFLD